MRDRKELLYLNIADLTEEEQNKLSDYELNCCDKCGQIDISEQLYWLEYFYEGEDIPKEVLNDKDEFKWTAICSDCYNRLGIENNYDRKVNDGI